MKEMHSRLGRWMASAGLLAILGFGATQALASPPDAQQGQRACNLGQCHSSCRAMGYDGGTCAGGMCTCYKVIE
ncbi:MAG TPA: hypothetical protein VHG28_03805 [Longimicrobiaceae bacterium]|nr:hypothetical protein [Longimicrobiaceae bacterium]